MSTPSPPLSAEAPHVDESLVTYTHVIYALHALAVIIGLSTFHTIVGSFIGGLPSIVAVIMNYARRSATRGTYLESHFRWQIRTFWFALLWLVVAACLFVTVILIPLAWLLVVVTGVWVLYRIGRGWLALNEGRTIGA